jgi:hypothetical protein
MAYEVFVRKARRTGTPSASFQTSGRIALNAAATKILTDLAVEMVLLLWDPVAKKVGIRPAFKKDQKSYKLSRTGKGNGAGFSAVTFFEHIGFDHTKETKSFPAEWNSETQMFEINMAEERGETSAPLLALDGGIGTGRRNTR